MPRGKKKELKEKTTKAKVKTSPTKKTTKKKVVKKKAQQNQKFYDQLKLSESYISLILGSVVVVGASFLFLFIIKESRKNAINKPAVLNSSISPSVTKSPQKVYVMKGNETLWDVAVREYGDGFAWVKIADANKDVITNPDFVPPGTNIIIPQ